MSELPDPPPDDAPRRQRAGRRPGRPDAEPSRMLNAAQVARKLGVSQPWVRRHADDGDLPGYNYGGTWRFDAGEIERWKIGKRNTASAKIAARKDPAGPEASRAGR